MQHTFETHQPVELYVEIMSGELDVTATETTETTVSVTGRDAEEVTVEQDGDRISVIGPRRKLGFLGGSAGLSVAVTVPTASRLATRTGSADLRVTGVLSAVRIKSGSGDCVIDRVDGEAFFELGSGDIEIGDVAGDLRVKSGSGTVDVDVVGGHTTIATGSGDVTLRRTAHPTVVKTGSGDLRVEEAMTDVSLSTASGDLYVGRFGQGSLVAKNVSGDVHVGVPSGVPVWTDVSSVTGRVGSNLVGAGQPAEGQDHIEIRATSVSGDVVLEQL